MLCYLTGSTVLVSRDLRRTMSLAALAAAAACCAAVALSKIAPRIWTRKIEETRRKAAKSAKQERRTVLWR